METKEPVKAIELKIEEPRTLIIEELEPRIAPSAGWGCGPIK